MFGQVKPRRVVLCPTRGNSGYLLDFLSFHVVKPLRPILASNTNVVYSVKNPIVSPTLTAGLMFLEGWNMLKNSQTLEV